MEQRNRPRSAFLHYRVSCRPGRGASGTKSNQVLERERNSMSGKLSERFASLKPATPPQSSAGGRGSGKASPRDNRLSSRIAAQKAQRSSQTQSRRGLVTAPPAAASTSRGNAPRGKGNAAKTVRRPRGTAPPSPFPPFPPPSQSLTPSLPSPSLLFPSLSRAQWRERVALPRRRAATSASPRRKSRRKTSTRRWTAVSPPPPPPPPPLAYHLTGL